MAQRQKFLGKYRGRVFANDDPQRRGRVRAEVADVLGREPSSWALPCLPFTGTRAGHFNVPEVGAGVWIEFEQGDPSHPIWTGCWYGEDEELPQDAQTAQQTDPPSQPVVIQTSAGHKVVIFDTPGDGVLLQSAGGAFVHVRDGGVRVEDGDGGFLEVSGGAVELSRRRRNW